MYSHSSCVSFCVCIVHQALLLIGRWMEETAHYAANRAIQQYKVKVLSFYFVKYMYMYTYRIRSIRRRSRLVAALE